MGVKFKDHLQFKRMIVLKGMTQRELGRALGIAEPFVNQLVNGVRNPGPQTAKKITELFGTKFDDIFFIEDDSKSDQAASSL